MTSAIKKGTLREKLFKVANPAHLPIVGTRKRMCRETRRFARHRVMINSKGQEPRHSRRVDSSPQLPFESGSLL